MSLPPEKVADLRVKHLEMVQAIVARMAGYGASLKGLCITVTTAVCGFGISMQRPAVILMAVLPVLAFAVLDAQCLRVERRFRLLYDALRQEPWDAMPSFEINLNRAPQVTPRAVVRSWSVGGFYGPLTLGVLAVALVLRYGHAS